jgi:hypothetical protein
MNSDGRKMTRVTLGLLNFIFQVIYDIELFKKESELGTKRLAKRRISWGPVVVSHDCTLKMSGELVKITHSIAHLPDIQI